MLNNSILLKKIFGLKQKCFFCYPSNFNKFQISCQRTDFIRQISFSFLKKCFKSKISDFSDVIYTTSKKWVNNVVK